MGNYESVPKDCAVVTADAPGRVNLIGEHTDYNGGFVLPTAIPQRTHVELMPRPGRLIRVSSSAMADSAASLSYLLGDETPGQDWLDYIQGVTHLLAAAGFRLSGFEAKLDSSVPLGSGLSSSASLTVSLMRALRRAFGLDLDDVQIARLGQRVENEFVGARVGIMDPMAASLADEGTALFLDARDLSFERIPLPAAADLVVLHSGVVHKLTGGDYNTRRRECEEACALLGVGQLRDLGVTDLAAVNALPEPLCRRARHVITENDRVLAAVQALRTADLTRLGQLFYASHESMRDDYQISVAEIDLIIELARSEAAVYGVRLTGGGFGGSVVMMAHAGSGRAVAERIAQLYAARSGCQPRILVPTTSSQHAPQ
ncbi:MAG TPA: galactokinase [Gemmataceae bacterium]|nr:galactokinase [Gemmataceae bacterium]